MGQNAAKLRGFQNEGIPEDAYLPHTPQSSKLKLINAPAYCGAASKNL
jgi:hypothetical protein